MPDLRRRAKKNLRKRHKKTIKLREVDKIWNDYVEYGIVRPLLKYGKIHVDDHFSIEIVGHRLTDAIQAYNMLSNGLSVTRDGYMKPANNMANNRPGVRYKIVGKETNYTKGQLIFKADPKLSKRVSDHLRSTTQYYRIEQ